MTKFDGLWSFRSIETFARQHPIASKTKSLGSYIEVFFEDEEIIKIIENIISDFRPKIVIENIVIDFNSSVVALGRYNLKSIKGRFLFDNDMFAQRMQIFRCLISDYYFPDVESLIESASSPAGSEFASEPGEFVERYYGNRHVCMWPAVWHERTDEEKCILYADIDRLLSSIKETKKLNESAYLLIEYAAIYYAYENYKQKIIDIQKENDLNEMISAFGEEFRSIISASLNQYGLDQSNRTAMAIRELERRTGLPYNPRGKWSSIPAHLAKAFNASEIVHRLSKHRADSRADVSNSQKGIAFERRVADAFTAHGFTISQTAKSGDFGVDLIAEKNGLRTCLQCKDYRSSVGVSSVQEVFAGMKHYRANYSCVIASSTFTRQAYDLASSLGVKLFTISDVESYPSIDSYIFI